MNENFKAALCHRCKGEKVEPHMDSYWCRCCGGSGTSVTYLPRQHGVRPEYGLMATELPAPHLPKKNVRLAVTR